MRKIKTDVRAAFSLMEMMVVLLIISIIAAASAPMVSKKLSRDAATGESPLVFTNLQGSAAFNMSGQDVTMSIGRNSAPAEAETPRLYIDGRNGIAFGIDNGNYTGRINIGVRSKILVGNSADKVTLGSYSVGIGNGVDSSGMSSIAIGNGVQATETNSIAIGKDAKATKKNSIAIGYGVNNTTADTVVIGNSSVQTVTFGGNSTTVNAANVNSSGNITTSGTLKVGTNGDNSAFRVESSGNITTSGSITADGTIQGATLMQGDQTIRDIVEDILQDINSDRRLKNVGEKFTDGLDALKKLDLFHYTYKEDKDKTPHVGVMAQDLQKVFPNAVKEGEDGYLRIRLEDMFYAVINAVKELDIRISEVINQVKANVDEITKLKATVAEQQQTIDELKAQNAEFEKRLARLEGKAQKTTKAKKAEKVQKEQKVQKEPKAKKTK